MIQSFRTDNYILVLIREGIDTLKDKKDETIKVTLIM